MSRREVAGLVAAGIAVGGVLYATSNQQPVPLTEVTADLHCAAVTEQDEFAQISGTSVDAVCSLPGGQVVHLVQVSDRKAFRGYLYAHPDLTVGYPDVMWQAVGTPTAIDAAGLASHEGEG